MELMENPKIEVLTDEEVSIGLECKVVLFNDDWHTFEEVISQIIRAVKCSFELARNYTFEVHVKGKAVVYQGQMNNCLKVTSVLEEISLLTQIVT